MLTDLADLKDETIFTDANVLIYMYWVGLNQDSNSKQYRRAFLSLQRQGTRLVVNMTTLNEVANRVFQEQWKKWNEKQIRLGRKPVDNYKQFRNNPIGEAIMDDICDIINNQILEQVELVDKNFDKVEAKSIFKSSKMDFPDKIIEAICKEYNYVVFTHDGDFKHSIVDVVTANGKILKKKR
jgi:predicted nucleic acid-binding protein